MKQRIFLLFLLFHLFNEIAIASQIPQYSFLPAITPKKSHEPKDKSLCLLVEAQQLRSSLIRLIHDLYRHLDYWQSAQFRPVGYFIEKGPLKWFSNTPQNQEIQENIEALQDHININTHYLGLLSELMHNLEKASNQQDINELTAKIWNIAQTCLYHENHKKNFAPNHVARHWLGYSITSIAALCGLSYLYVNRNNIGGWIDAFNIATKNFYTHYVYQPIKNSINTIYKPEDSKVPRKPLTSAEEKSIEENTLKELVKTHLTNNPQLLPDYQKLSKEQTSKFIEEKAEWAIKYSTTPQEIMLHFTELMKSPRWNTITSWGDIERILLIQLSAMKLHVLEGLESADEIHKTFDELYKANKLNFQILLAFPAALLAYLSYKLCTGIYHYVIPKKNIFYRPLKKSLIALEALLNQHNDGASSLDYNAKGHIIYLTESLKKNAIFVPHEDRHRFISDIEELTSETFTIAQKHATVVRMFRAYSFLRVK